MDEKSLLSAIKSPRDIKQLDKSGLESLCSEIRETLVKTISCNGGHLASNLGVVELTVAIHKSFNSPYDNIVWDVGHQSYTHKLLTGRFDRFGTIRQENGLSGYTRPQESEHDVFLSGHSGTGVSAGFGLAEAKQLKK
ncbi:MAG TPA: 1-deoxy-D-xylulose-5-phosphate synthase N-terminal domain-containing protein, partial [Clostridiales bacterium]|nr:1-deoxy-D-xylulose-5-phosphate synthase N-terminal domain-containing protein [Clostridiales bacterium]